MSPPPYNTLALALISTWQASLAANLIAHPREVAPELPAAGTFAEEPHTIARPPDPFGEPFARGSFVAKLESSDPGEEGLYNIVLLRHPRSPYSFALATKDPHPSSEPARAPFFIHAHRLLIAIEDALSPSGERGIAEFSKGVDAGDADGGRKRFTFHFASDDPSPSTTLDSTSCRLPAPSSLSDSLSPLLERTLPPSDNSYNVILTRYEMYVFAREQGAEGLRDGRRVDGGALFGF